MHAVHKDGVTEWFSALGEKTALGHQVTGLKPHRLQTCAGTKPPFFYLHCLRSPVNRRGSVPMDIIFKNMTVERHSLGVTPQLASHPLFAQLWSPKSHAAVSHMLLAELKKDVI